MKKRGDIFLAKVTVHASESISTYVVDTQYFDGIFCVLRTVVVFFAYCGGYALLWWVVMLDVVGYNA